VQLIFIQPNGMACIFDPLRKSSNNGFIGAGVAEKNFCHGWPPSCRLNIDVQNGE